MSCISALLTGSQHARKAGLLDLHVGLLVAQEFYERPCSLLTRQLEGL